MTDRVYALTVVLEEDLRTDDVEPLIQAIERLRGVLSVGYRVSDLPLYVAQERARQEWREKLVDLLWPERVKG